VDCNTATSECKETLNTAEDSL